MKTPAIAFKLITATLFVVVGSFPAAALDARSSHESGFYPLAGFESGQSTRDLRPFGSMVRDASIVGLGEVAHASRGFHVARKRLIRYLIEEHGARLIILETPWLQAMPATRYVERCDSSSRVATSSLFEIYHDAAIDELFQWICDWNRRNPTRKVEFYGNDIQENATYTRIIDDLARFGIDRDGALAAGVKRCAGAQPPSPAPNDPRTPVDPADHQACADSLEAIGTAIRRLKLPAHDARDMKIALVSALAKEKVVERNASGDPRTASEIRDKAMAEIAVLLHESSGRKSKTVLLAHNAHVQTIPALKGMSDTYTTVGMRLRKAYGESYLPFSITAYRVLVDSGISSGRYPEYPVVAALETEIHLRGADAAFIDLRKRFFEPHVPQSDREGRILIPGQAFRGIFFMEESLANIFPK